MNFSGIPRHLLDGFYCGDELAVQHKLAMLGAAGPEGIHVVSDFDLTLTAGKTPGHNLGTWDVMDELMPPEGVERHREIYHSFRPIELEGKLTEEIAIEKWGETLDLIASYRIPIADVEDAFLAVAMLRDGAKELFDVCRSLSIPTVVLSSGIRNVIQLVADRYDIRPDYILSNDMIVDEDGRICGWRPDTLIHILNKGEKGHSELSGLRSVRPHVILLGDVPDDTKMVAGEDVLRVRVLDPRKGENHDAASGLQASFDAGYDLVVESDLSPLSTIIHWLAYADRKAAPTTDTGDGIVIPIGAQL